MEIVKARWEPVKEIPAIQVEPLHMNETGIKNVNEVKLACFFFSSNLSYDRNKLLINNCN